MKVMLIGDSCIDAYEYVTVSRISPEAPVPVCVTQLVETKQGMAANVKTNLEALGVEVDFYTGLQSTKKRIIDMVTKQHVVRIDNDVISDAFDINLLDFTDTDAVIVSDYNKGFITYDNLKAIISLCDENSIPVFVDTKKQELKELGKCYIKINELEYRNATSYGKNIIVTRSGDSVMYKGKHYPVKKQEVVDVCGAGDTFISALVYKYLKAPNISRAIEFAIKASSVTVQHTGVYAPTLKEIK